MEKAIENAIYYSDVFPPYLENSICTYSYDSQNIKHLSEQYLETIDTKIYFGDVNSTCYQILKTLPYCYKNLLLNKIDSVYIVDKYDKSIRIYNTENEDSIEKIAIIRIDSVKSELKTSWSSWFLLTGLLGLTAGGAYFGSSYINE